MPGRLTRSRQGAIEGAGHGVHARLAPGWIVLFSLTGPVGSAPASIDCCTQMAPRERPDPHRAKRTAEALHPTRCRWLMRVSPPQLFPKSRPRHGFGVHAFALPLRPRGWEFTALDLSGGSPLHLHIHPNRRDCSLTDTIGLNNWCLFGRRLSINTNQLSKAA